MFNLVVAGFGYTVARLGSRFSLELFRAEVMPFDAWFITLKLTVRAVPAVPLPAEIE
jgi:hypothetical protein